MQTGCIGLHAHSFLHLGGGMQPGGVACGQEDLLRQKVEGGLGCRAPLGPGTQRPAAPAHAMLYYQCGDYPADGDYRYRHPADSQYRINVTAD